MMDGTTYGLKNSYIEAYLGTEDAVRMLPKWEKLEKHRGLSFNIGAFLFSFFWCFHKKMYREFVIFLAAFLILPLIVGGIAGISRMEGELTPKSVCSELRRIPVIVRTADMRDGPPSIEEMAKVTPWYDLMLAPVTSPAMFEFRVNSEPAFYFALFRVLALFAVNLICGILFNYLYMKKVCGEITAQLSKIKNDNDDTRKTILRKSAGEHRSTLFGARQTAVFMLFGLVTFLPVFYDAVCIIYNY